MSTIRTIVRINANGRTLEFVELHPQAPEALGFKEIILLAYTFKDRRFLDDACTAKLVPGQVPGEKKMRVNALPEFNNGLALVGDGEVVCILKREFYLSGRPMAVFNELVSYGLATNRYMAYQALEMDLLDNCMMANGIALSAHSIARSIDKPTIHMLATGLEALIGAVWADTQGMADSADIVAWVMAQFGIRYPRSQLEETQLRGKLNALRHNNTLMPVGSSPEKGFFSSGNC
ncbi:hypothetical protein CLAFUW4_04263 [Fulvia fulva]|nr:hypothetical protein CLAFUR4_04249 [Fulvia fulva]WPV14395.1 hypothetical protein CLAFUW4_04263 [Fulvia fulva]